MRPLAPLAVLRGLTPPLTSQIIIPYVTNLVRAETRAPILRAMRALSEIRLLMGSKHISESMRARIKSSIRDLGTAMNVRCFGHAFMVPTADSLPRRPCTTARP